MNDTPDATPRSPGAAGSADENPVEFYAPGILFFVILSLGFAAFGRGESAVAMALLAHLLRCLANDDMRQNATGSATEGRP